MTVSAVPFAEYVRERMAMIEEGLKQVFPREWCIPRHLREAMEYSLFSGGKRLRPLLTLAAAEALDESPQVAEAALAVGCAIEMIHTYSLIHDDLPAMDDDDFRRGRPTNHRVFGEAMAILAGDALLTHAFYVLARIVHLGVPADVALAVVEDVAAMAGPDGMVGGQASDIRHEDEIRSAEDLEVVHTRKTAKLIVCSIRSGGRLGGASAEQLERLSRFGEAIGLAFQIRDDILDADGTRPGYPGFVGIEAAQAKVSELTESGKRALLEAGLPRPQRLLEIADFLVNRSF